LTGRHFPAKIHREGRLRSKTIRITTARKRVYALKGIKFPGAL
jgi:hypothetical protein